MSKIELLIKTNIDFIIKYTKYEKSNIIINNKIKKCQHKLLNINNTKKKLFKTLIPNINPSKKILKNYFPYLYNEKKKIKKSLNKYIKFKYINYNINEYIIFIKKIKKIILSNTIIENTCHITCPICLDTKITCMVKLTNHDSIGINNGIVNMSNCKGTIICYNCCIDMYLNREKNLIIDRFYCLLCNKKIYFNKHIPPFNILITHTKIIDTILENEYYIFENKMNIKLPSLFIYDHIKFKYLKDLNLYLLNKNYLEIDNYNDSDYFSNSDSDM